MSKLGKVPMNVGILGDKEHTSIIFSEGGGGETDTLFGPKHRTKGLLFNLYGLHWLLPMLLGMRHVFQSLEQKTHIYLRLSNRAGHIPVSAGYPVEQ
jgi:hypothetical protein